MKNIIHCGFDVYYGKKAKRPGLYVSIVDTAKHGPIGKLPYFIITCKRTDAEARARLLIVIGQEIRYMEQTGVDPSEPNTEKTVELEIQ